MHHANWIGGRWGPAATGFHFELKIDGRWPRSGIEDVAAALAAARGAAADWRARTLDDRVVLLEELLDVWEGGPSDEQRLAELLGLDDEALDDSRIQALETGDVLIEAAEGPESGGPHPDGPGAGLVLVRAPAAELAAGLVSAVFPPLLAGRTVLLLSDPDLPRLAEGFAALIAEAGLPPGVLSLLHDDGLTCLRAALLSGEVDQVRFGGTAAQLAEVARLAEPGAVPRHREAALAPFGAGVLEPVPPELTLHSPRNSTLEVGADADPEQAAMETCQRAFGPARALSGQRAGQVGRVLCHQRIFSRFTEALLAEVEEQGVPCALFDGSLMSHAEELCRLGLDEGATLIHGGLDAFGGRRRSGRGAAPVPSIFTNVEPQMQLAGATRPAPVLSLLRSAD